MPQLSAPKRLLASALAWGLIYLAGPGVVEPAGIWPLALAGVSLWAWCASRPGPWAFRIEVLAAGTAWCGITSWAALVHWSSLLFLGPGFGLYFAATAALARRLARRFPLALAAPVAWCAIETLRAVLPPPFGIQWMRLGTHLHDLLWLSGSARVWGVGGLSFALAAAAGLAADLANRRARRALPWIAGLGPAALAVLLSLLVPAPATRPGPRWMTVQPAVPQERKMEQRGWAELLRESLDLTEEGLASASRQGEPPPDLVSWGETMLPVPVLEEGLVEAWRRGARPPPWSEAWDEEKLELWSRDGPAFVRSVFFGEGLPPSERLLPEGTSLVAGVEYWKVHRGRLRRQNAAVLWDADGRRRGVGAKVEVVPGAERLLGLERYQWARDLIFSLAGYVPDLLPAERTEVLELVTREGRRHRFGVTVCFDNAFDWPYVEPLRRGDLDFHLVLSNEAWFRSSLELDQMIAFSRLIAIQTGRTVARATNSGISAVLGPDGRELARLVVGGRDREVPGTLRATLPVPVDPGAGTPFVRVGLAWVALWILAPGVLAALARRKVGNPLRGAG